MLLVIRALISVYNIVRSGKRRDETFAPGDALFIPGGPSRRQSVRTETRSTCPGQDHSTARGRYVPVPHQHHLLQYVPQLSISSDISSSMTYI